LKHDPRSVAIAGPAATTNTLGDWYANRLNVGHQRLILCTNERTLLSVVVPAKDLGGLPRRLGESVSRLVTRLGASPAAVDSEIDRMETVRFDRTASRSVLGSMNEFSHMAAYTIREGKPLDEVGDELSQCPCMPLDYYFPYVGALELLGGKNADSEEC
jgi:hypothetical protein